MTAFEVRKINVESTTLKCLTCGAEGLNTHIIIIPLLVKPEARTPDVVMVFCKDCILQNKPTFEVMDYADYLKLVNLPSVVK